MSEAINKNTYEETNRELMVEELVDIICDDRVYGRHVGNKIYESPVSKVCLYDDPNDSIVCPSNFEKVTGLECVPDKLIIESDIETTKVVGYVDDGKEILIRNYILWSRLQALEDFNIGLQNYDDESFLKKYEEIKKRVEILSLIQ